MLVPRLTYVIPQIPGGLSRIEDQLFRPPQRYSMYRYLPSIESQLGEPSPKSGNASLPFWIGFGETYQHAHAPISFRCLPARSKTEFRRLAGRRKLRTRVASLVHPPT